MRPRSLMLPLLLIAIGGLLLMNSLRPDLPLFDVFATYWPFLLIGWGVLRLMQIVGWQARRRPLPATGLSGGEWTFIVLLSLSGYFVHWASEFRPWRNMRVFSAHRLEMFGRTYDFQIPEQAKPAGKTLRVIVENLRGNARITGADITEIRVSGRKTIRALQERDAEQASRQSELEISVTGEQAVVRSNQDRVTGDYKMSTDLEITVPRGAAVEGRGREGDFEISDLNGPVEVVSDNAGVRIQNVAGNVRVNLRRSDVVRTANIKGTVEVSAGRGRDLEFDTVEGAVVVDGQYSGELRFTNLAKGVRYQSAQTNLRVEKVPGQIQMDLGDFHATQIVGPARFTTDRARDVQIDGFTNALEISIAGGDITLRPAQTPLAPIQAETRSGNIELALPEAAKFELKARTYRGEVHNDFGFGLREESEGKHGALLLGSVGNGPVLLLNTNRGNVSVRKDSGQLPAREKDRADVDISTEGARIRIQKH